MNDMIQTLIVCLIVCWSMWRILKRYLPHVLSRQQQQWATYCRQHRLIVLANWLQPTSITKTGCDSGCGGCSQGCSSTQQNQQAVKFVDKIGG